MSVKKIQLATPLLAGYVLAACTWFLPADCQRFFDLPGEQRRAEFRGYPVEKQVRIYLCGMRLEPPEMGWASEIAAEGPRNIPYLLERLKTEPGEGNKEDLIFIFAMLGAHGHLKGRQDVVAEIERVVASIRAPMYRDEAERSLEAVKQFAAVEPKPPERP